MSIAATPVLRDLCLGPRCKLDENWAGWPKTSGECVEVQPNGYLAVDYGRLCKTPEARSLPLYRYRYIDGSNGEVA